MTSTTTQTAAHWIQHCGLPRHEARILLQYICGWTHAQTITRSHEPLRAHTQAALMQVAAQRHAGEPIAYIVGMREFYGRRFHVNPAVLIPRPETEHLLEAALDKLPPRGVLWDLGTGSGIIAVSVACERPDAHIWASDISDAALHVAQHNAQTLGGHVHFGHGSWFDAMPQPALDSVDVVVSNPPYIEATDGHLQQGDLRFEPAAALTDFHNGLTALHLLIAGAPPYLKSGGWLLLEHGFDQGHAVRSLMAEHGYVHICTQTDLAGLDRVTLGQL